jgi:hypothetical protein
MFFVLMVDTPRSPSPPLMGPTVDVFRVDGGCSWISSTTSKGARHRYFFALIVGTLGSLAPPPRGPPSTIFALMVGPPGSSAPPPRELTIYVFCVHGGCSRISDIASQVTHRRYPATKW